MRFVVCSNSGPLVIDSPGEGLMYGAAGGLVPLVQSLLQAYGGQWLFAAPPDARESVDEERGLRLSPVQLSEAHRVAHYERISIETFLWLFHYIHDLHAQPTFDAGWHRSWAIYAEVNRSFAARAAAAATNIAGGATVFINDYHLMLIPSALRQLDIPAATRLAYSHFVPWCEPDYFRVLPPQVRTDLLRSILLCDVVSFASSRWRVAFERCCEAFLPDVVVEDDHIVYGDRRTRLVSNPLVLDADRVTRMTRSISVDQWHDSFSERVAGRRVLVRVDRLDLWKNHVRGVLAFEELLARRPGLANDLHFLVVTSRPRYRSARHVAYERELLRHVHRINESYRQPDGSGPIALSYPSERRVDRFRALAALRLADVVLINPISDGFNLVAKEAVLVNSESNVMLSTTAGAYEYMSPAVLPVEPFDISETANILEGALGHVAMDRTARVALSRSISADSIDQWVTGMFPDLSNAADNA